MSGKPRLSAKQKKQIKKTLCELLEKSPIIEMACQKVGISRMTLGRWRKADTTFDQKLEEVLMLSRESINDLAESKMMQGIQEGNASLIRFWLKHNCDRYKRKPDVKPEIYIHTDKHDADQFAAMIHALPEQIKTLYKKDIENN